jgi:hypothetical protein
VLRIGWYTTAPRRTAGVRAAEVAAGLRPVAGAGVVAGAPPEEPQAAATLTSAAAPIAPTLRI